MTNEEWYKSTAFKKLRMLHNLCHDINQTIQKIDDVFDIICEDDGGCLITVHDKYSILVQQLRIMRLENERLQRAQQSFNELMERVYKIKFDDEHSISPVDSISEKIKGIYAVNNTVIKNVNTHLLTIKFGPDDIYLEWDKHQNVFRLSCSYDKELAKYLKDDVLGHVEAVNVISELIKNRLDLDPH